MTKRALSLLLCLLMLLSILPMAAFAEDGEFDELPSEEPGYQEEFLQEQDHLPDGDLDPQDKGDDNEGEKIQIPEESVPANYPQISLQPADVTVLSGKSAAFTVKATQAKKYQWQVSTDGENWTDVPKATKNKLSVKAEKAVDGNLYRCVVSNADGSVNSKAATLTVTLVLPTVLLQPADENVRNTKKAAFSVKAKNAKKYQWQVSTDGENWKDVPKATKNKLTISKATEDMDGNLYRCSLSNADGKVETDAAALSVYLVYPTVVTNPTDQSVRNGKKATFTVKGDKETKKYQWQVSADGETWTDIPKATKNKYAFNAAESMNNNQYRCILSNADGSTPTAAATLTVGKVLPQVVTEPQDAKVKEGANAAFTVKGDKETKKYQWQVSTDGGSTWKDVAKGTSSKLTVSKPAITLSGSQYRCVLSNMDGETISSVATLTVGDEPAITAQPQSVTTSAGETVTFTIGAVNVTSYQWQRCPTGNAWTNIPGATDSSYTFTAEDTQNGYKFRCKLKNTVGETTSEAATLIVRDYFDVDLAAVKTGYINAGYSVHDPSIFVDGSTYYIFGSHMETAKSTDLRKWTAVGTNYYVANNSVYGNIINNKNAFAWAGRSTSVNPTDNSTVIRLWAPDVIYNPTMGKYMMYFCVTSSDICSSIGFSTADKASGPYTFQSLVLYSGFTNATVDKTDAAQYTNDRYVNNTSAHGTYPNALDPSIFFDKDGRFWMVYGSWSGGIWLLELDPATGKRIQNADYTHSYFGYKLGGGNWKSGEAPYILWDEEAGYYYLFVSYGELQRTGGYQIRVFRSENVTGPYVDQRGNSYLDMPSGVQTKFGLKLSGNYLLPSLRDSYMSTGHNSAFIETKDGITRRYVVYHTRFANRGEAHEPRVRQYVLNEEGWPCILPYATAGETFSATDTYTMDDVAGRYYVTSQGISIDGNVAEPVIYRFNADGTILLGDGTTGTWSIVEGTPYIHYTLNKQTYKGILCPMKDEAGTEVFTFSALYLNYSVLGVKY